jgi:hypothetical protein
MDSFKNISDPALQMMDKIILTFLTKQNDRGITILYVLLALLICSVLGVGIIKFAGHDVQSSSDFGAARSAQIAAHSGLQACVEKFQKQPQQSLDIINKYRKTPSGNEWLAGSFLSPVVMEGELKYCVRIRGVSKDPYAIQVESTGWGKDGSMKRANGVYRLDGLKFDTARNFGNEFALFVNGRMNFEAKLTFKGKVFANDALNFNSGWCDGSIFMEAVVSRGNASFAGQFTFMDVFYCGGNFYFEEYGAVARIEFMKKTGFQGSFTDDGESEKIWMRGDTYFNGSIGASINNLFGNVFHYDGGFPDPSGHLTNYGSIDNRGAAIDIPKELNVNVVSNPPRTDTSTSVFPINIKLSWTALSNDAWGNIGQANNDIPAAIPAAYVGYAYTGDMGNAIYAFASGTNRLVNGFAVVEVDEPLYAFANYGTFTGRIIFINHDQIIIATGAGAGWPNSGINSITAIHNVGQFMTGQNKANKPTDLFRGYVYNDTNSVLFAVAPAECLWYNIKGSFQNMRPKTGIEDTWHPDDAFNQCTIEYDREVMKSLASTGYLKNLDTAFVVIKDSLILKDVAAGLLPKQLGLSF